MSIEEVRLCDMCGADGVDGIHELLAKPVIVVEGGRL